MATRKQVSSTATTVIDAPVDTVWTALVDHEGMDKWVPGLKVKVTSPGNPVPMARATAQLLQTKRQTCSRAPTLKPHSNNVRAGRDEPPASLRGGRPGTDWLARVGAGHLMLVVTPGSP